MTETTEVRADCGCRLWVVDREVRLDPCRVGCPFALDVIRAASSRAVPVEVWTWDELWTRHQSDDRAP